MFIMYYSTAPIYYVTTAYPLASREINCIWLFARDPIASVYCYCWAARAAAIASADSN